MGFEPPIVTGPMGTSTVGRREYSVNEGQNFFTVLIYAVKITKNPDLAIPHPLESGGSHQERFRYL